jgi:hypothetical protein
MRRARDGCAGRSPVAERADKDPQQYVDGRTRGLNKIALAEIILP